MGLSPNQTERITGKLPLKGDMLTRRKVTNVLFQFSFHLYYYTFISFVSCIFSF